MAIILTTFNLLWIKVSFSYIFQCEIKLISNIHLFIYYPAITKDANNSGADNLKYTWIWWLRDGYADLM